MNKLVSEKMNATVSVATKQGIEVKCSILMTIVIIHFAPFITKLD